MDLPVITSPTAPQWRDVLARLSPCTDEVMLAWHLERRPDVMPATAMRLAIAVASAGEDLTTAAVVEAGGNPAWARWLWTTARRRAGVAREEPVPPIIPAFRGPLFIDPSLGLPDHLEDLAGEMSDHIGTLVVVRSATGGGPRCNGKVRKDGEFLIEGTGERRTGWVVLMATDEPRSVGHEFGHILAPRWGDHSEDLADAISAALNGRKVRTYNRARVVASWLSKVVDGEPAPLVPPEPHHDGTIGKAWHDADGIPDHANSAIVFDLIGRHLESTP